MFINLHQMPGWWRGSPHPPVPGWREGAGLGLLQGWASTAPSQPPSLAGLGSFAWEQVWEAPAATPAPQSREL